MIELFVTDIDGCLGQPYVPYDLDGLATLRRYAEAAGRPDDSSKAPALTICSGRPYPYVEALTQVLGVSTPVLFESGGGQFDPVSARTTWSPQWTDEQEAALEAVRHWFVTECIPGTGLMLDRAKHTQAGVITPNEDEIPPLRPRVERFVEENALGLHVFTTDNSVDVVPEGITKRHGLEWLADTLESELEEIAYIGDTDGDLSALEAVGTSFAPANAQEAVRAQVDHVTESPAIEGTIEAYRHCRRQNER
ncbi:MAG: HAD family hydrolase [Salinibacter sp.]|uniref:HAD family hydrolase n=1 Tax=Salinibacter sp. TaxID=2065818 RepID=UPI0035D5297D